MRINISISHFMDGSSRLIKLFKCFYNKVKTKS